MKKAWNNPGFLVISDLNFFKKEILQIPLLSCKYQVNPLLLFLKLSGG
jgi:hypothetical protein